MFLPLPQVDCQFLFFFTLSNPYPSCTLAFTFSSYSISPSLTPLLLNVLWRCSLYNCCIFSICLQASLLGAGVQFSVIFIDFNPTFSFQDNISLHWTLHLHWSRKAGVAKNRIFFFTYLRGLFLSFWITRGCRGHFKIEYDKIFDFFFICFHQAGEQKSCTLFVHKKCLLWIYGCLFVFVF